VRVLPLAQLIGETEIIAVLFIRKGEKKSGFLLLSVFENILLFL